eukprot:TRINITY_DN1686_c0_g3_i2.p1 TRINITY_DN1686_c0_g3~~TRINITY_DN1686_c0_g3_i2.p1  ORF type:complete len:508 (-),score=77.21 TRINITY_DN1686_c0_g3_i2:58-1581(-)
MGYGTDRSSPLCMYCVRKRPVHVMDGWMDGSILHLISWKMEGTHFTGGSWACVCLGGRLPRGPGCRVSVLLVRGNVQNCSMSAATMDWSEKRFTSINSPRLRGGFPTYDAFGDPPSRPGRSGVSLNDEFLQLFRDEGLEELGYETGLVRNGRVQGLGTYGTPREEDTQSAFSTPPSRTRRNFQEVPTGTSPSPGDKRTVPTLVDGDYESTDRRGKKAKGGRFPERQKGLRSLSLRVCEKVERKRCTTYNEVADELVAEFAREQVGSSPVDQNIRRRVYDALNVLMAMGIIQKERKDIHWRGLPTNARREHDNLLEDAKRHKERVERKRQLLQELLLQQIAMKKLTERNKDRKPPIEDGRVSLPFILCNTRQNTLIECEMSPGREDIFFNFSLPFEIHDDNEILKWMGLQHYTMEEAERMVPQELIDMLPSSASPPPNTSIPDRVQTSTATREECEPSADLPTQRRGEDGRKVRSPGREKKSFNTFSRETGDVGRTTRRSSRVRKTSL